MNWKDNFDKAITKDWDQIFQLWEQIISKENYEFNSLFTEISIIKESTSENRYLPELTWWTRDDFQSKKESLENEHLKKFPRQSCLIHPFDINKGSLDTLTYLYEAKKHKQIISPVLFLASLFPFAKSTRKNRYGLDPYFVYFLEHLYTLIEDELSKHKVYCDWSLSCTTVLPYLNRTNYGNHKEIQDIEKMKNIKSLDDLIIHFSKEHIALLKNFTVVDIEFIEK